VAEWLASRFPTITPETPDTLSFNEQVISVCKAAKFHHRALRHILNYISEDTAETLACSMIDGQPDYFNALLYETSAANIHILQRVQKSMARAVTNFRRTEHNI